MKSPFSPWFLLYVMVGVCVAFFAHEAFFRQSGFARFDPTMTETTGLVRSIHEEPEDALSKAHAIVVLGDGAVIDGAIAPGCLVLVGDRVTVHVLQAFPAMQKSYLVVPQNLPHKD